MTFCIGIRVQEGLVALADTQTVRGEEVSSKAKLSLLHYEDRDVFLMTSGLRSIRDKAVMRLENSNSPDRSPSALRIVAIRWPSPVSVSRSKNAGN